MRRYFGLLIVSISIVACMESPAISEEYLDRIRDGGYDAIFVTKILSASTVAADKGGDCYYNYESTITQLIQGAMREKRFAFSSRLRLTVGDQYLTYFSEEDARLHRFGGQEDNACERRFSGYLLLYNELHHIDRVWNGEKFVTGVKFNDVWAEISPAHELGPDLKLADFAYVRDRLKK